MKVLGVDCSRYAVEQPTGVEIYTDRVVEGLVKEADSLGYDELRLYVKNARQLERLMGVIEKSQQEKVQVKLLPHQWLWTMLWLSGEILRNRVEVLFVPSHVLPLVLSGRSVWTVHGVEALSFPQIYTWRQRNYHRFALWWAKRKGAQFVAVSEAVKKDLVELGGVDQQMVRVIYNGFDSKDDKEYKEAKGLVEGDFILSVGRLEKRKNQLRLVKAFEQIAPKFDELKLVLVGPDGYGADRIREGVEKSKYKERIYLTGYQDPEMVRCLFKKAKVFAYPSLAEGFGIPILEAFDAGLPVLTSKGSACEEVAGDAAVLCEPFSANSIAKGLGELLSSQRLRKEMRDRGKKRVELFSWQKCVQGLKDFLKTQ